MSRLGLDTSITHSNLESKLGSLDPFGVTGVNDKELRTKVDNTMYMYIILYINKVQEAYTTLTYSPMVCHAQRSCCASTTRSCKGRHYPK